jgi:GT2 family glycosyltransferase
MCSVIIPVYNKPSLTRQCLDALLAHPPQTVCWEIIVVDDGSADATADLLACYGNRIRVIRHAVNAGFATTCNDGAAAASGEYLVFLNNDTIPQPGWLDALAQYADAHPRAAAVGSKLLFPNNTIQHAGVVICKDRGPRHIYATLPGTLAQANRSRRFQVVTGACVLIRRDAFYAVDGFDPAFRNGFEDVDFCLRLGEKGCEVHYCHESVAYHLESVTREGRTEEDLQNLDLYRSRWADRVRWDDLQYYVDDGMFKVHYPRVPYPFHLDISPLLAVVKFRVGIERRTDELLIDRSRQEFIQLRDNIRMSLRVREMRLEASRGPARSANPDSPWVVVPRALSRGPSPLLPEEPARRPISIVLAVKNSARRLEELLPLVLGQRVGDPIEIVAVDTGSTDDTVDVLRRFEATVASVAPHCVNTGMIRNLAVPYARGRLLVFLDQGALPADDRWLANLVAPLDNDPAMAAVCSRVLPHPKADPLARRDGLRAPRASAARRTRAITDWAEYLALPGDRLTDFLQFHRISAAIRPEVFKRIPFPDNEAGQEQLWAKEVLEAGFRIRHEPSSVVCHSPGEAFAEILKRAVDQGRASRRLAEPTIADRELDTALTSLVQDDWKYLARKCRLDESELERWQVIAAWRRMAQVVGQWLGAGAGPAPPKVSPPRYLFERLKNDGAFEGAVSGKGG